MYVPAYPPKQAHHDTKKNWDPISFPWKNVAKISSPINPTSPQGHQPTHPLPNHQPTTHPTQAAGHWLPQKLQYSDQDFTLGKDDSDFLLSRETLSVRKLVYPGPWNEASKLRTWKWMVGIRLFPFGAVSAYFQVMLVFKSWVMSFFRKQ